MDRVAIAIHESAENADLVSEAELPKCITLRSDNDDNEFTEDEIISTTHVRPNDIHDDTLDDRLDERIERSERSKKKIGGKKRSRIENGVLLNPYDEKPKI